MRLLRLVPMLIIVLVLSGMQTILMVDQTNAACCNLINPRPLCDPHWWSMVYGSVERNKESGIFRINNKKGYSLEVIPSQEVIDQFESREVIAQFERKKVTKLYGMSILQRKNEAVLLTAFVPSRSDDHGKSNQPLADALRGYDQDFQKVAKKPTSSHINKITNASMVGR